MQLPQPHEVRLIYSGGQSRYPLGKMAGDPPKSSFGPGQSLPEALYEGLREAAFRERRKINEIVVEGIEMALRKRRRG